MIRLQLTHKYTSLNAQISITLFRTFFYFRCYYYLFMKVFAFLFILLLLQSTHGFGQADSILAIKGDDQQVKGFLDWANRQVIDKKNREAKLLQIDNIARQFNKAGNKRLYREAWFCQRKWELPGGESPKWWEDRINGMLKAAEDAGKKGWRYTEAECRVEAAEVLFNFTLRYSLAFEQLLKGYDLIMQAGLDKYPEAIRFIDNIATRYYKFGDYATAIRYFKESIMAPDPWASAGYRHETYNTIGLCYQAQQQYDSAIWYFQQARKRAEEMKDEFWVSLADGNAGYTYYLQGKYEEAIPLMKVDFEMSIKHNQVISAVNAAMGLATIYTKYGDLAKAEEYFSYARKNIDKGFLNQAVSYYRNLYHISKLKGDYRNAVTYVDSFMHFRDSQSKIADARIINQAKLKVELEQHSNELKLLESTRNRQVLLRNALLASLILSGIIAALLINRARLKRNKALELAALEKKLALEELEHSRQELHSFTNTLKEKNDLIETFRAEIEKLQRTDQSAERIDHLNQLLNTSILTEDDWKHFRQLFDKVYPGFFIRLKEKMPDLSPADTRLMALTKLQLSQKEMAAMLGVGYDAIRKARQRLRQKISLPEEGSLDEVVEMI